MTETEALAALNALHSPDPDGWKPGTPTDYMTCKGCDVLTLGGGSRRLWKDCPTRAILARVGSGAVPPQGVTLTPEEAATAASAARHSAEIIELVARAGMVDAAVLEAVPLLKALAARLGAAS